MDFWPRLNRLIEKLRADGTLVSRHVEEAIRGAPRHMFVPKEYEGVAYVDEPLPIGRSQTISQPSTVVLMTEALDVLPGANALEIGAGSGWQAALLSRLVGPDGRVTTIERHHELAAAAEKNLKKVGITNVEIRIGDGTLGVPRRRFDRILVAAGAPSVPSPLVAQLKEGGLLVIPIGEYVQDMFVYRKTKSSLTEVANLGKFRFVPLVGKYGF